jgi:hypothetical protein
MPITIGDAAWEYLPVLNVCIMILLEVVAGLTGELSRGLALVFDLKLTQPCPQQQ